VMDLKISKRLNRLALPREACNQVLVLAC